MKVDDEIVQLKEWDGCASRPARGEATRPGQRASRSSSSARPTSVRIRAKTSMANATGGLTSGVVRTFDRLGRSETQALNIEAVTSPGPFSRKSPEPILSTIPLVSTRHAACSCEQLRLTVEGEPVRVSICHCLACQRRTGSVFGVQARFDAEQVTIEGRSRQYIRVSDDGEKCAFHFCPDCGATVFYAPETSPGIVAVPVGAFADPSFPAPTRSVWEERRHSWLRLPDDIEHVS